MNIGVIGMMKSGKSSVLNALLGMKLFPSSIQAQTAVSVHLVHVKDAYYNKGILYQRVKSGLQRIANEATNIRECLLVLNRYSRAGESYSSGEFEIRISIPFLREPFHDYKVMLADTVGADEAGLVNYSLQDFSKYSHLIIVINYRSMKTEAEANFVHSIRTQYSRFFSNKERILVVVNAIDAYYVDGNNASINPQHVAVYVNEYLNCSLCDVLPISAKWGLITQDLSLSQLEDFSESDYNEALSLYIKLNRINSQAVSELQNPSFNNKQTVLKVLRKFSSIDVFRQKVYAMTLQD